MTKNFKEKTANTSLKKTLYFGIDNLNNRTAKERLKEKHTVILDNDFENEKKLYKYLKGQKKHYSVFRSLEICRDKKEQESLLAYIKKALDFNVDFEVDRDQTSYK